MSSLDYMGSHPPAGSLQARKMHRTRVAKRWATYIAIGGVVSIFVLVAYEVLPAFSKAPMGWPNFSKVGAEITNAIGPIQPSEQQRIERAYNDWLKAKQIEAERLP